MFDMLMGIDNKNKISSTFVQNITKCGRKTGFNSVGVCGR